MLFNNSTFRLCTLFAISSALNVIVLDLWGDLGFVGVTKFSALCVMNLMIFGCPEIIDCGLGVGVSVNEYPGGVRYSVLLIMLVLLLRRSS